MQDVVVSESRRPFGTYAEPLSGLRISWGSLLAGAVAMLSVSMILWALGLAIVALATHGTWASVRGSIIALWIIAMGTTLVGAYVGGFIAGVLPGNSRRRIGAAHGFIAWGVAFLVASAAGGLALGAAAGTTALSGVDVASSAVQATGAAAGAAEGANAPLSQRAEQTLVSLGYTPAQARRMVGQAQNWVQQAKPNAAGSAVTHGARSVADRGIDLLIAMGWSWWGTWFASMLLAVAGGASGARLLSSGTRQERVTNAPYGGTERRVTPMGPPLTPRATT